MAADAEINPWGEDLIGTVARRCYPAAMNKLLRKKIIITIAGTAAIATLSHSAIMLPNGVSHFKTGPVNHESVTGGALHKSNSLAPSSRYRILGDGPWPANLPYKTQNKTNTAPAAVR